MSSSALGKTLPASVYEGPIGAKQTKRMNSTHFENTFPWTAGKGQRVILRRPPGKSESQYNILKGASWKFWAYGEVVTREGNSKHWERKYLWKAAATAYLCEIIMAQNKAQGLPVCSWMGSWKNKRKKKEADVYNCSFRRCLLALQGWRLCSHEKECFKPQ